MARHATGKEHLKQLLLFYCIDYFHFNQNFHVPPLITGPDKDSLSAYNCFCFLTHQLKHVF